MTHSYVIDVKNLGINWSNANKRHLIVGLTKIYFGRIDCCQPIVRKLEQLGKLEEQKSCSFVSL
jgi:hypothetical protein